MPVRDTVIRVCACCMPGRAVSRQGMSVCDSERKRYAVPDVTPATLFLAAATGACVVAVLAVLLRRREVRLRTELLERLERLEARLDSGGGSAAAGVHLDAVEQGTRTAAGDGGNDSPTGDVLAGLTSRVERIAASDGGAAETLADHAIYRIQKRMEANLTAGELADELFVSLRTLERGLALGLACTPSQLILAMKMREARRMLLSGRFRVAEVAERLGFANPFHFSRRFKGFYRVAPSELRPGADGSRPAPSPTRLGGPAR
jgi:AraC-like DNA-binding protein